MFPRWTLEIMPHVDDSLVSAREEKNKRAKRAVNLLSPHSASRHWVYKFLGILVSLCSDFFSIHTKRFVEDIIIIDRVESLWRFVFYFAGWLWFCLKLACLLAISRSLSCFRFFTVAWTWMRSRWIQGKNQVKMKSLILWHSISRSLTLTQLYIKHCMTKL